MHSAYVRDAFSHFDSCTVNIESAINDLDPLLRVYADDSKPATEERLGDLRNILRDGAKFAFLLFFAALLVARLAIGAGGPSKRKCGCVSELVEGYG